MNIRTLEDYNKTINDIQSLLTKGFTALNAIEKAQLKRMTEAITIFKASTNLSMPGPGDFQDSLGPVM